jgi:hypothetical protein
LRGRDTQSQWQKITELIGTPSSPFIDALVHAPTKTYVRNRPHVAPCNLELRLGGTPSPLAMGLIKSLLVYDVTQRPDAVATLGHPFFHIYTALDEGPVCGTQVIEPGGAESRSIPEWRELVLAEVALTQAAPAGTDTSVTQSYITDTVFAQGVCASAGGAGSDGGGAAP